MENSSKTPEAPPSFTNYQKLIVAILAFLQFTIILDFMILSPLGAILMPALNASTAEFGFVVSAYAFSAGLSGILAGGFADRFDRKKLLLFFYCGFLIGTLLCALATSFQFLLFARIVTGLFGGVIGSIVFAITTDLFPFSLRGRVMGLVQTSFVASQVLGIPIGLFFANHWGWHSAFLMIVAIGALAGIVMFTKMQPVTEHLKLQSDRSASRHLLKTISNKRYLQGFATTALLATGGFMLMPFSSAFTVHNVGIPIEQLPLIYMITGLFSIFMGPMMGRMSDRFGKFKVFLFGSGVTVVMAAIYTHLGVTPIELVILVNVVMFIGITARMVSSQALISAVPGPADRGSYMAISASVQQISGGLAAALAGLIVVEETGGVLRNFDVLGYVVIGATLVTLAMMQRIHKLVPEK